MSYSAKCRIDQKLYATNCRIGEIVFDELSCTRFNVRTQQQLYKLLPVSRSYDLLYSFMSDENKDIRAVIRDFQLCGILTSVDSDEPVHPHFKL